MLKSHEWEKTNELGATIMIINIIMGVRCPMMGTVVS